MDQTIEQTFASDEPLDIVEQVLMEEQHPYERDMLEVHFAIAGAWSDHQLWFAWRPDVQTLHLHLGLDIKTPPSRRADLCDLMARVNERLPLGHFDSWEEEQAIVYRSTLPLIGQNAGPLQVSTMIAAATEAADRFFPAFNFLIWAGKSPKEAADAAMFETVGQA
ncbi:MULTISPECIES: YbjN domain-containing protein [Euryhalocaulis]|uniref:YbjN domain-containing protein n=1 Tax=Euryhalocaulis TaxID=1712422 RepID=UPI0003A629AE|nr:MULTISPECIES: YbjN domain-containing protein [Euryhalocaulis]MBA4801624.1 YbjN domain-containing protein [Euryhalocaulis sp.]